MYDKSYLFGLELLKLTLAIFRRRFHVELTYYHSRGSAGCSLSPSSCVCPNSMSEEHFTDRYKERAVFEDDACKYMNN